MLQQILISSFFSYGMFTIQRPGFLMAWMRPIWKTFPKKWHETLFECGICVASLWGGLVFLYTEYIIPLASNNWHTMLWLPVIMIAASGVNSFLDRGIKAFEKHYGYKPPQKEIEGEKKWEYLMPYDSLRKIFADNFVLNTIRRDEMVIEIGGLHHDWKGSANYVSYSHSSLLNQDSLAAIFGWQKTYSVVIMGLAFDGDLRILKKLIEHSHETFIEYSDDGISKQQIEQLTEGIKTKVVLPEFTIEGPQAAPKECGQVSKRKIILLKPCKIKMSSLH